MADFFSVDLAERGCFNELCHAVKRCIGIICRKEDMICSTSFLGLRLWKTAHHPGDNKINEVFPRACKPARGRKILAWEEPLIQGKIGEIGLAHWHHHRELDQ